MESLVKKKKIIFIEVKQKAEPARFMPMLLYI